MIANALSDIAKAFTCRYFFATFRAISAHHTNLQISALVK
jgi:hypothetical protein